MRKFIMSILKKGTIVTTALAALLLLITISIKSGECEVDSGGGGDVHQECETSCKDCNLEMHVDDVQYSSGEIFSEDVTLYANEADGTYDSMPIYNYGAITITINYANNDYGGVSITQIYYANDGGYNHTYDYNGYYYMPETLGGKKVTGLASNIYPRWDCNNCNNHGYFRPKGLRLPKNLVRIEASAFSNAFFDNTQFDLTQCTNLEYIGNDAFYNSSTGKARQIIGIAETQTKLKTIGNNAFRNAFQTTYEQNKSLIIPNIQSIGNNAFDHCYGLKNCQLGDSLKTIGVQAFKDCIKLENIYLSESITSIGYETFKGCVNLLFADVQIKALVENYNSTTRPSEGIFYDCNSLTIVQWNDNITYIPNNTFRNCNVLADISLSPDTTYIGKYAFYHNNFSKFVLPAACTELDDFAFAECGGLATINLLNVQIIGNGVFTNCVKLEEITIPSSVTSVGTRVFENCSKMTKVLFNTNAVNDYMFLECTSLSDVKFYEEDGITPIIIEAIPNYFFKNCISLSSLEILYKSDLKTIGAYAFEGTGFTNITLNLNQNTIGEYAFARMPYLTEAIIGVKMISSHMFYECEYLETVTIAASVNNESFLGFDADDSSTWAVGDYAFARCIRLKNINLQNDVIGDYMFSECVALQRIVIPETINYVGTNAFEKCTVLDEAILNNGVLGSYMFSEDTELKQVSLSTKFTKIPHHAFYRSYLTSITIPSSIIEVGEYAFAESLGLIIVDIQNGVIGDYMFKGCSSIQNLTIPASVHQQAPAAEGEEEVQQAVGTNAFENCTGLLTLNILNNSISEGMFKGCINLGMSHDYTLVIPSTVQYVGDSAFENCTKLYKVSVENSIIGDSMFKGCSILNEAIIGANVTEIGQYAFQSCVQLSKAILNNTKTSDYMFAGCTSLTQVEFSEQFVSLGAYTFEGCIYLGNISIESTVFQSVGNYAFKDCTMLKIINFPDSTTSMGEGIFFGCETLEQIDIPFVGAQITAKDATVSQKDLFIYIFGKYNAYTLEDTSKYTKVKSYYSASGYYEAYVPNTLSRVNVKKEVVYGYGAFYNCTMIQSITVPATTVELQKYAFYNCTSLEDFNLTESVTTFGDSILENCTSLENFTTAGTAMGKNMLKGCTKLQRADIFEVLVIPASAFENCTSLTDVYSDKVTTINERAFYNCSSLEEIVIDKVTTILASAFQKCSKLDIVILPLNLKTLGASAFADCSSITNIVMPQTLVTTDESVSMGASVFQNCTSMISVKVKGDFITASMFKGCSSLFVVEFENVKAIPANAFDGCSSLEYIEIPAVCTVLGNEAFKGCISLKEIIIPEGITSIGTYAFQNCTSLQYARMENIVLGTYMFYNCSSLEQIYLKEGLTTIPAYCFYDCTVLQYPTIPSTVTSFGEYAFARCLALRTVVIPNTVNTIGLNVFWDDDIVDITVPFVGYNRTPSYYTPTHGTYGYMRYSLGWFFGATSSFPISSGSNMNWYGKEYSNSAKSYLCRSARYAYNSKSTGSSDFYRENSIEGWYLPKSLKKVSITDTTIIPYQSLWGAYTITNLSICDKVTTIRPTALYGCTGLVELTLPFIGTANKSAVYEANDNFMYNGGNYGQYATSQLGAIFFAETKSGHNNGPADQTNIWWTSSFGYYGTAKTTQKYGDYSISYMLPLGLKTLNIVNNRYDVYIMDYALNGCTMIENINFSGRIVSIGNYAITNTGIKSLTIPETVTAYGQYSFSSNTKLENVEINNNITASYLFNSCTKLNSVVFNKENTPIKSYTFNNCSSLENLDIVNCKVIEASAFNGCASLTNIRLAEFNIEAGSSFADIFGTTEVSGMVKNEGYNSSGTKTSARYLPQNITITYAGNVVDAYKFYNLSSITGLILEENVTTLGDYAFGNLNLTEVRIPSATKNIGVYVFTNNQSLERVIFGESHTSIPTGIFNDCISLEDVIFEINTVYKKFVYVSNNVYELYTKNYTTQTEYATTNKFYTAGNDGVIQLSDLEAVKLNNEFYLANADGTYYAYGKDNLLGTIDDQLIKFGPNDSIINIKNINGVIYYDYLDNTYSEITFNDDLTHTIEEARYCLIDNQLVDVVVYAAIPYLPVNGNNQLFNEYGEDGLLGTDDDTYAHLSTNKVFDNELITNIVIANDKMYKSFGQNVYKEVIVTEASDAVYDTEDPTIVITPAVLYNIVLGNFLIAGEDLIPGTTDDILSYDYNDYEIITSGNMEGYLENPADTSLYVPIVLGEDNTYYLVTRDGNYLGHGYDLMLGTADDIILSSASGNYVYIPEVVTKVYPDQIIVSNSILNNKMYSTIVEVGEDAFRNCESLKTMILSEKLDAIYDYAFAYSGLTEIIIPDSVDTFGEYTFAYTESLLDANIQTVHNGRYMFNASALITVQLVIDTAYISDGCFANCEDLTTVTFNAHYIQAVKYPMPNGIITEGADPITHGVLFLLSSTISLKPGLDEELGTADDYYEFNGKIYLVGNDLINGTVDDVLAVLFENKYYKDLGNNLYSELTINYETKEYTESSSLICAGLDADLTQTLDNINDVSYYVENGEYYILVNNIKLGQSV